MVDISVIFQKEDSLMENEEIIKELEDADVPQEDTPVKRKRGGRKPFTPEQKEAAAKAREEQIRLAATMQPEIYVQFQQTEANVNDLIQMAKDAFRKEKKRTRITGMKLYLKPEERCAYYVINETSSGKIEY